MTKWQEFPLRPQGRPWPGLNTRSGKLDDGSGQMTDSSINCIINRADSLAKRKGIIRGLDERFAGSVCGLHKYTDECGREWLVVADEAGFSVRQPFSIPSFSSSDAYPSDAFDEDGPVNQFFWRNTAGYEQAGGSLVLVAGQTDPGDLVWFKDATNFSYEVSGSWSAADAGSVAVFIIKRGTVARIEARIQNVGGVVSAELVWVDSNGSDTSLGSVTLATTTGTIELSYNRDAANGIFTATLLVQPEGGSAIQLQDLESINAIADADLGQGTAVRLESTTGSSSAGIASIQGEPI